MRAEEIAAVSQAIKILNDDDALDLFKKTLSLAQIDGMVKVLAEEQATDDETKAFCSKEIGAKDAEQADTEEAIAQSTAAIEDMTEESATLASEIASLQKEIKALDKAVAEATEQRKEEHSEFLTFQTENNAALQLIE